MDKAWATHVTYLDTCTAFNMVPLNILTPKLGRYGFDAWTVRRTRNYLGGSSKEFQSMPECSGENQQQVVSVSLKDAY